MEMRRAASGISMRQPKLYYHRYKMIFIFCALMMMTALFLISYLEDEDRRTKTYYTVYSLLSSGSKISKNSLNNTWGYSSLDLPRGGARLDNQRLIRIYDFIRVGNKWEELLDKYDVCLTTQTSIERLHWVPEVLRTWNGPLSLAVLVANEKEWLALNLYSCFLERCYPSFSNHVTLHLAVPVVAGSFYFDEQKVESWNVNRLTREVLERDCNDTEGMLNLLLDNFSIPKVKDKDKLAQKLVYPQNHLRNLARKGCPTDWTFSTDVDIIPREGMAEMLQEFYFKFMRSPKVPCKKCAFVIPTFELHESKPFPKTKSDLIKYVGVGAARGYHEKDYVLAQQGTDYTRWMTTNKGDGPTRISHKIRKDRDSRRVYEPFYVSSDSIPPFDERFLGYGSTRSSQFQEALLAGWDFSVLSPVFSIHWGLHRPTRKRTHTVGETIRNNQTVKNRYLFQRIVKEMKLKRKEGLYN